MATQEHGPSQEGPLATPVLLNSLPFTNINIRSENHLGDLSGQKRTGQPGTSRCTFT